MTNNEYNFAKEVSNIVKERWHALEVEQPTQTNSNELHDYDSIELDYKYTEEEYMDVRYSTEYLLEITELLHSHFNRNMDISMYLHLYRLILSDFEGFGRMMTYLELKYEDAAYIFDPELTTLTEKEQFERSDIVKEYIGNFIKSMPNLKTWIIDIPGITIQDLFLMLVVVVLKMIELEQFVQMLIDEDDYPDDEDEFIH